MLVARGKKYAFLTPKVNLGGCERFGLDIKPDETYSILRASPTINVK
jgi:hypothetical protein